MRSNIQNKGRGKEPEVMKEVENICSSSSYCERRAQTRNSYQSFWTSWRSCLSSETTVKVAEPGQSVSCILSSNSFCSPNRGRKKQICESLQGQGLVRWVLLKVIGKRIKDITKNVIERREFQCPKKEVKAGEVDIHEERCLESSP